MAGPCPETFDRLAHALGHFGCGTAQPIVQVRAPWELSNWTLFGIETLLEVGMVYGLVHALYRWRRAGDPMALGVWLSSIVYLLLLEPTVYFPAQLGLPGQHQVVFVHNLFTVQFMYARLPLYIVALYSALSTFAYELVRLLGVAARRGVLVGALAVGVVHQGFYEVFDQVGPQLRWWVWNDQATANHLRLAAVPLTSSVFFVFVGPVLLVLSVQGWIGRRARRAPALGGWGVAGRAVLAGACMLPALGVLGAGWIPMEGALPAGTGPVLGVAFGVAMFVATVATALGFWRWSAAGGSPPDGPTLRYVEVFGWLYLVGLVVFWAVAMPAYLGAHSGVTRGGTAVGSLPYALAAGAGSALLLVVVVTADRRRGRDLVPGGPPEAARARPPSSALAGDLGPVPGEVIQYD